MSYCDFLAGWTGGVVGLFVGFPLDTLKVIQQTRGIGIRQCFQEIHKHGYKGFFRGMGFPLVGQGVMNSAFFGVYGYTLDHLNTLDTLRTSVDNKHKSLFASQPKSPTKTEQVNEVNQELDSRGQRLSYVNVTIAGCIAGIPHVLISCPVDLVKIRLQTQASDGNNRFRGPIQLTRHILRTRGVRGMYQGLTTMAWRDVPSFGVYMLVYEFGSNKVNAWGASKNEMATAVGLFMSGGFAGTICWWMILPIDVVKSRIQAQDRSNPAYKGAMECTRQILKEQGLKGFFRGFWSLSIRAFPVNGATLLTYEWFNILCRYLHGTTEFFVGISKPNH